MSFTAIDIQRFVGSAIEKASIDNKIEIKFDMDNFMKTINGNDERCDDVVVEKKKLTKEERQANKEAKEAEKKAKEQAKADKLAAKEAEKQAKEQAKADKLAAKEAEKKAKEQAKADKLAAKEAEKKAKLDAKEAKKKEKEDAKPKGRRGRPKKDNVVVASGDYIENIEAQSVDLVEQLAQDVSSQPAPKASSDVTNTTSNDDDKFEDVQVHLFEFAGVMYYKSDDHVLYHHETQEELGNWDPVLNVIVYKEE